MKHILEPDRCKEILSECVSSVFADTAFIDVVPTENIEENAGIENIVFDHCAIIDVLMPVSCRIVLHIQKSLSKKIAETLFAGLDESEGEPQKKAEDSILEILNIIAGLFLSRYFGTGTDIQLELPQYLYEGNERHGQLVTNFRMDAEGERIDVALCSVRYPY